MDLLETIVVYVFKIGRCSKPNEHMDLYEYQMSRSFEGHSDTTFSNFSIETDRPLEAKFHMEPPWDEGTKICSNCPGHITKMAAMPIYGKKL